MRTFRKPVLLFAALLLLVAVQPQQLVFNKVLPPDGSTFTHVTGMVQDPRGLMWLATKNGLYAYDGYRMTTYKNNPLDTNSLAGNALECIAVDGDGVLWIGTVNQGLERFDPETGVFTHIRHRSNDPASIGNNFIVAVLVDHLGDLWVGTGGGLDRFDRKRKTFVHYRHDPGNPQSLSSNEVVSLYEDRQQTLWIGTGSVYGEDKARAEKGGLNRFNRESGTFTRYVHDPADPQSLVNNKVKALYEDSKGQFWVGTAGDGLHRMDRRTGRFRHFPFDPAHPEKLSRPALSEVFTANDQISFIREDVTGGLWIGTTESGLNHYDAEKKTTTHYLLQKDTIGAFTNRTTWCAATSSDGVLWISTLDGELFRVVPFRRTLPFYPSPFGEVSAFFEEADGTLWTGTITSGLLRRNPVSGAVKQFLIRPDRPAEIGKNNILAIIEDRRGNFWLGTGSEGLLLFDKRKGTYISYKHAPGNPKSIGNNFVISLYEDREGGIWAGTLRGLNRLEPTTGTFTRYLFYPQDQSDFGPNTISSMLQDGQQTVWVGSAMMGGLHRLDPRTGTFKSYLKGKSILQLSLDPDGTFWVSDIDGLFRFEKQSDSFYRVPLADSWVSLTNSRSSIRDGKGNFWFATAEGLVKLDPRTRETTLYGKNYGIARNELSYGANYLGPGGKLYFGSKRGYYAFDPGALRRTVKPPVILFSTFRVASKVVAPGEQSPLIEPFWRAKTIVLEHNQNVFSFEFAAIDFANPEENRHLFMLENYDDTWRQSGMEHQAYYFNVPPGRYIFRVRAANSDGVWAEKSIAVLITPPWWRTWWAYTVDALLLIAGLYALYHLQRKRLIRRERERASARELAQAREIEKAYQELKATQAQLVQREKMASLGELTAGIAHEIQNPLNFVNNFSEANRELLEEWLLAWEKGEGAAVKALAVELIANEEKIVHHGKRAENIVKNMLEHSRTATGSKQETSINALTEEYLKLAYHSFRAKYNSFTAVLETHYDPAAGKVCINAQETGRVLLNLFSNAFYAERQKKLQENGQYEPVVVVSTKKEADRLTITVKDNGIGIPEKLLHKIYQPFFTTKPAGEGTGLGLSLSYDIVTKGHGGELKVESVEGQGSEFTVQLPLA